MTNKTRILHLAMDEKFIDQAYRVFEEVAPGDNDIFLYAQSAPKYTKTPATRVFSRTVEFLGMPAAELSEYGLIVVHSLHQAWWKTILNAPVSIPVLWLGWGYDYYDLIDADGGGLLLSQTRRATQQHRVGGIGLRARLEQLFKRIFLGLTKEAVIGRVDYFSPVLSSEYHKVEQAKAWKKFPRHIRWNYGNLEDDFIKGFEAAVTSGSNILVGNSAAPTNNHLEAFELLSGMAESEGRQIIVPLSYGLPDYRALIVEAGEKAFPAHFLPLTDFMPISEYVGIISSCSHVVMNHVRQQALGNIVIMLYLGAKVFVREESPVYSFFRSQGAYIFSVQDLEKNPSLLSAGLQPEEARKNREVVTECWSRQISQHKTRELLQHIFTCRDGEARLAQ